MAVFHRCLDCKFAQWNRTAAGRLHPGGAGRCVWTKSIALPASIADYDRNRLMADLQRARWIDRKEPVARCDTFVRDEPTSPSASIGGS